MADKVLMPQLGESVVEGTIVEWFVNVGDRVEPGTPLVEVETDKANTEVPATETGWIKAILVNAGDTISVGEPILELAASEEELGGASASESAPPTPEPEADPEPAPASEPEATQPAEEEAPAEEAPTEERAAAPMNAPAPAPAPAPLPPPRPPQISSATPWNRGGGVAAPTPTIHPGLPMAQPAPPAFAQAIQATRSAKSEASTAAGPYGMPPNARYFKPPVIKAGPDDTVTKFSKRRGIIAEHMVYSKQVSPHVPCFAEVDMTKIVELRRRHKDRLKEQGVSLTVLSFLLKATTQALREFPIMNAVVGADEIIVRGNVHLGVAVETAEGLLVPVIRDADTLSVTGLAKAVVDLADKARNKKITIDDLSGGTFTVTNPGRRGNLFGAAVINQPQVGIVRMGEIVRRPVVRVVEGEEVICIRSMMYLALTYDHRIIDGVTGNGFLYRVRELLEGAEFQV